MIVNKGQKAHQYEILVVDDAPASLQLLTGILTRHGYRVRPAVDGRLALQSITARRPDLILLDVKMPDIDGYEVCRRLKSDEQSRKIPVIFISAFSETIEKVEGFKAGGVDYITKPFQRDEVLARVGTHLRLWELTEQLEQKVSRRTAELTTANQQLREEITQRKRAEEEIAWNLSLNQALSSLYVPLLSPGISIEQIANIVLEKSRRLTGSAHGYVAEIDPVTGDLIAHTHTKMMQTECKIAEEQLRKIRFPRRADGIYNGLWGHALNTKQPFYTDEPAKNPATIGVPEGHIAIERFLAVPVLLAGELVGQIALSNSARAYTDRDLDAINRMADFYALAIQHKRTEEKISRLNQELEQRVLNRTAELEAANEEMHAFTYTVAHDLRAPLRHIDGFVGLLQKTIGTALDQQSRHYMDTISNAAQKMGLLIDDILSLSRMGRHALSFQSVELGPLVSDVIRELEPDAAGRDIVWRIGDLPAVNGDASMLRMVLSNLIANALKFTRPRQQARIEIGCMPATETENVIFVRDNGVGFDMTYADKLFGVFQRLHRTEEFEGTGIGLATVHRIVARHGGRTWAEGQVDNGAAFYFSLPCAS